MGTEDRGDPDSPGAALTMDQTGEKGARRCSGSQAVWEGLALSRNLELPTYSQMSQRLKLTENLV